MKGFQRRKAWNENYFYEDLDEALKRKGSRTRMESRVVAANTRILRMGSSDQPSIAVKYHYTDILMYHPDNRLTLYNGGWNTVTTMQRMRTFLDQRMIGSYRSEWHMDLMVSLPEAEVFDDRTWTVYQGRRLMPVRVAFTDGMTINLHSREIVEHPSAQPVLPIGSQTFEAAMNDTRALWAVRDELQDLAKRKVLRSEHLAMALNHRDAYIKVQEQFANQLKAFEIGTSTALYALEETVTQLAKKGT